ncbi:MAG: nucleotidyltransferase, partial [Candidatus Thermofonsia Clade 1 bacterium]
VGVKAHEVPIPYGVVESEAQTVIALREKPTLSVNINAGIYAISPEALRLLPHSGRYDATQLIQAALEAGLRVCSYQIQEYWLDIGRFEDYHKANEDAAAWLDEE